MFISIINSKETIPTQHNLLAQSIMPHMLSRLKVPDHDECQDFGCNNLVRVKEKFFIMKLD